MVISARFAPLPPSRYFCSFEPSSKAYTYGIARLQSGRGVAERLRAYAATTTVRASLSWMPWRFVSKKPHATMPRPRIGAERSESRQRERRNGMKNRVERGAPTARRAVDAHDLDPAFAHAERAPVSAVDGHEVEQPSTRIGRRSRTGVDDAVAQVVDPSSGALRRRVDGRRSSLALASFARRRRPTERRQVVAAVLLLARGVGIVDVRSASSTSHSRRCRSVTLSICFDVCSRSGSAAGARS